MSGKQSSSRAELVARGTPEMTHIAAMLAGGYLACSLILLFSHSSLGNAATYPVTAITSAVLAVALLLATLPSRWKTARIASISLAVLSLLGTLVMTFFALESPSLRSIQGTVALSLGFPDSVEIWRPALGPMLIALFFALAIILLFVPRRWAATFTAFVFMAGVIVSFWSMGLLAIPSYIPDEVNRGASSLATLIGFIGLCFASLAGIFARPKRAPISSINKYGAWPLIIVAGIVALVGVISTLAAYRIALEDPSSDARYLVYFFQALIITSLGIVAFWFIAFQHQRTSRRARNEGAAEMLLDSTQQSPIPTAILDADGLYINVNSAFESLVSTQARDIRGLHYSSLMAHPPDNPADAAWWPDVVEGRSSWTERREYINRNGDNIWTDVIVVSAPMTSTGPPIILEQFIDVTHTVETEQQVRFLTEHDSLTRLLNRESFRAVVAEQGDRPFSVLVMNIDRFTFIVNAAGADAANQVLREIAGLMRNLYPSGVLARSSSDEFYMLVYHDALSTAEKLISACDAGVALDSTTIRVGLSIGIASSADTSEHPDILRLATAAMRRAKKLGGHRACVFSPTEDALNERMLDTIESFRKSLLGQNHGRVEAWMQPIVDLSSNSVAGYEALARWVQADGQIVSAAEWIELIELEPQLVHELAMSITDQAAHLSQKMQEPHFITINISGIHVSSRFFPEFRDHFLSIANNSSSTLILELTETALDRIATPSYQALVDLSDHGVQMWADDFGTGYSSLAHLRDLPITGLKLDKSFTQKLSPDNPAADGLVNGLAYLADELSLTTVAEGIENEYQALRVREAGWKYAQGWYFGRPQSLNDIVER